MIPIVVVLLAQLVTWVVVAQRRVDRGVAQQFLTHYYEARAATDESTRRRAYEDKLTAEFRQYPGVSWEESEGFFQKWHSVEVVRVSDVSGNPYQFVAQINYTPKSPEEKVIREKTTFTLVCADWLDRLPRILKCSEDDLKIDNTETVSLN